MHSNAYPPQPPPPPLTPMTADQDPRRGDPSESDVPAVTAVSGPNLESIIFGVFVRNNATFPSMWVARCRKWSGKPPHGLSSHLCTSRAVWIPGMAETKVYHTIEDMEEACEQAMVIVIGEAQHHGRRPGGHYRGASYDCSLQVAPLCFWHGIMGTLVYTRETFGQFSLRRLQLGVDGSKGYTAKGDCRRSPLVQGTQEHGPLLMMVGHIARRLVPEWVTWTTIQLSRNEMTAPHQHRFDSTPWSAVFSTGQHVGGEIWVEEGCVASGPRGRPRRRHCPDGINRAGHRYRVDMQRVVVRTGAWHATCPWEGDR